MNKVSVCLSVCFGGGEGAWLPASPRSWSVRGRGLNDYLSFFQWDADLLMLLITCNVAVLDILNHFYRVV